MKIENLKVERIASPHGIVAATPEFTWTLSTNIDSDIQTACEIEVDLIACNGNATSMWRSGKLPSKIGDGIHYAGSELRSRCDYRWRARVWDRNNHVGDWSLWDVFETGVIEPDKIDSKWLSGGGALRKKFEINNSSQLLRARAYVSGLGYYEFFCNGRKVSVGSLAPSFTEFERRVEYEIIDLTPYLKSGPNMVGFLLADGWWRHGEYDYKRRVNLAVMELVLEYGDGHTEVITTDETWQASQGPLVPEENTSVLQIFDGVTIDLGWLNSGWCTPNANDGGWEAAKTVASPTDKLSPCLLPPVQETKTLKPISVKSNSSEVLSIDFGQNFTGWIRFRVNAAPKNRFTVRHSELLGKDGRLNVNSLRGAKQTDTFIVAGVQNEALEAHFSQHGFRYVEIEGPIEAIIMESVEGVVIHTGFEEVGHVTTSDERINWLLNAVRWTVCGNAMSIMSDVCQRNERRGWLMDGFTAFKAGHLFFNMNTMGRKWLQDMIDNQESDGSLRGDTAPLWLKLKSIAWQRTIVLLPMFLYENYGDLALLKYAYPSMCRYADYLLANLKDGLPSESISKHPPEWLCIGKKNDLLGNSATTIDVLKNVVRASDILGESNEPYKTATANMLQVAHKRWPAGISGAIGGDGGESYAQSNQVYALRFGLATPENCQSVFSSLVNDMMNARGEGPFVTTGIGSTEHLPIVLSEFDRDDLVWQWLQRDAYPGYGFMQRNGATTIWECWDFRTDHGMNAHNHTGLSGVGSWLMQYLVGIRTEPASEPVFHLRPAVHLPLASLSAQWQSRWGKLEVSWETKNERKQLTLTIPVGCKGNLTILKQQTELSSGTHSFVV